MAQLFSLGHFDTMNFSRRFIAWNVAAGCYLLVVVASYFALTGIIAYLHAEGFLAMFFYVMYLFTPIFIDLVPVIAGVAGTIAVVAECRQRQMSLSRTWLAGIGAALCYFALGCLLIYEIFDHAA